MLHPSGVLDKLQIDHNEEQERSYSVCGKEEIHRVI